MIRYIGEEPSTTTFGQTFEQGVWVKEYPASLRTHPQFECDPMDGDGDGKMGGSLPNNPPALTGKNKAALLKIGRDEGAAVDEDMTNAAIRAAIEDNRQ